MTRLAETLIDMSMDIAMMMASDGYVCLEDSRELVNRIQIAAEEFELVDWDFEETHDYFIEQERAAESLYKDLVEDKVIGKAPQVEDANTDLEPVLFANFYYPGNVSVHKTKDAAVEAASECAEEIAVPLYTHHRAAAVQPADAVPIGYANLFSDGKTWSSTYPTAAGAMKAAIALTIQHGEVAVPLYRHDPAPLSSDDTMAVQP